MRRNWKTFTRAAAVGGLIALAGCAGPRLKLEPIPVSANPTEEANKLGVELATARQNQINVLAPTWFNKAEASHAAAEALIAQKGAIGAIAENVSRGRAELLKAQEMAKIARTAIPEAIKGRELARAAGATQFDQDYADVEGQFLRLTQEIEDNNLGYATRNQQRVVDAFRFLEVRAIKENTLGEVRKLLGQAESEGARKLAPEVLADVQQELQTVDNFISANPYAKEEMHQRANRVLFKAKRLVHLTRQSGQFRGMQPIDIALWAEGTLQKIADKLGAPDMRDQPPGTQIENILGAAAAVQNDRGFLARKSKDQAAEIDELKERHAGAMAALRKTHEDEMTALKARYDAEVGDLTKKVAGLEGKSREEQARMEFLLADQRAERDRAHAERRASEAKLAAEKRAAEERLAAERRFNERYNEVQGLFHKDEAECYKQGAQMVLRLRGMTFPVGQSIIMPESYPILSKVQRAIRTFDSPDVTIEGHTDSTGTLETNNHLSQQRADAVRQYLLANGVVTEDKVTAAGYGPTRPLAPNTTAEGRAMNRRIDVIITPRVSAPQ